MKTHRISRTIVAAMVAVSLAGSGSAWADRKNDQRGYSRDHSGQHDKRGHDRRKSSHYDKRAYDRRHDRHNDKQYAYKKHKKYKQKHHSKDRYKPRYYRGYGSSNYYYDNKDDNDDDLLIGLLMGGLIGYAINSAQDNGYEYDSYPQSGTQQDAQAAIYEAGSHGGDICLQEREYQTKVIVGGRTVDAYGTACLQPDGSWSRGPAKTETF